MPDIFVGLFFGIFIGSIGTFILEILANIKETEEHNEEIEEENSKFTSAEQMTKVSDKGEQKLKDNTIRELFNDMEYVAADGDYTWYGHDNDGIHRDIIKHFTQQEIIDILEPLGYQINFNPTGNEADILMIRWGKDITVKNKED